MFVKAFGSSVQGVDAITISIEVNVSMGQGYAVVGLPDSAVRESLHRTESAIKNMGFHMPRTKVIVNLAPADIRKSGSALDLPIALGISVLFVRSFIEILFDLGTGFFDGATSCI